MIGWLRRCYIAWLDRHDPAWKPTGVKPLTEWHYDEVAAVKAARRAKRQTASGRHIPQPRKHATARVLSIASKRSAK